MGRPKKRKELDAQIAILAEIRRLRYAHTKPRIKPTGNPSPFRATGGTTIVKIAKIDADRIREVARERKCTIAQVVNARDW